METLHTWNKIPSFSSTGLTDEALWRQLLTSGLGETPHQHAGHSFKEHQWVHINGSGTPTTIDIDRHFLVRTLRLRYRDLAAIDPTLPLPAPSVILVRARAIALNLDVGGAIRIIICENQVYVLSVPKASDPAVTALPTETHPFVKRLCCCLKNSASNCTDPADKTSSSYVNLLGRFPENSESDFFGNLGNTIENSNSKSSGSIMGNLDNKESSRGKLLLGNNIQNNNNNTNKDIVNINDTNGENNNLGGSGATYPLQQQHYPHHHHVGFDSDMPYELRALEVALAAALGILTAEIDALEEWGYPAVDALLRQVDRDSLEQVRRLKNGIDKLQAKVHRIVIEIGDLMEDDDDMADLYLGRRAEAQGLLPLPQPGEERDVVDDEIERAKTPRTAGASGGGLYNSTSCDDLGVVPENGDEGIENDDDFEQEALVKEAEEALADRQEARKRDKSRRTRRYRSKESGEKGEMAEERRYRRRHGRATPTEGRNYEKKVLDRDNDNNDIDDLDSIAEDSIYDSSDLQDEALSEAEEAFLLRQGGDDNGSSSTYGGSGGRGYGSIAPRVDPHEIEEAEDLLESMFERADMLLRRLSLLDERCVDTEALLELDLDQKRNQLVGLNVVVSSMSMSFGFAAAIGGIFGMNLKNAALQEEGWVLVIVLVCMFIGSLSLIVAVAWYMKVKKLMFIPTTV